jgi:hypothetical protein
MKIETKSSGHNTTVHVYQGVTLLVIASNPTLQPYVKIVLQNNQ